MRFISLWVNTAFSTKYGSIFITASWMGSATRCILLWGTKTQASQPRATSSSSASRNSKRVKCKRRMMGSALCPPLLSDSLTDSLCSSELLSEEVPTVQMTHPLVSSSTSLIWASLCVPASQTPAQRDVVQPPPAASGTHNCARLLCPSVCLVCITLFYSTLKYSQSFSLRHTKSFTCICSLFNKRGKKNTAAYRVNPVEFKRFSSFYAWTLILYFPHPLVTKWTKAFFFSQCKSCQLPGSCVVVQEKPSLQNLMRLLLCLCRPGKRTRALAQLVVKAYKWVVFSACHLKGQENPG